MSQNIEQIAKEEDLSPQQMSKLKESHNKPKKQGIGSEIITAQTSSRN